MPLRLKRLGKAFSSDRKRGVLRKFGSVSQYGNWKWRRLGQVIASNPIGQVIASNSITACYKGITVNTGMKYTVKVSAHQPHSTFFQQSNVIERQNYVAVAITIASFFFYQLQLFQMWVVGQKSREEGGLNAVR